MSEEMQIDGKSYISSKRASQMSGYAQDYIGQLARKSLIDAKRIGGLWYVAMDSLETYKKKAEEFKPEPPTRSYTPNEPGTLVFFDGKEYLSAAKAAEITGYAQDYVGQLSRSGTVLSQQIGNRWYVERQSVLTHKKEKDRLLAAVQSESVGLARPRNEPKMPQGYAGARNQGSGELLNYFSETGDLMPFTAQASGGDIKPIISSHIPEPVAISTKQSIQIRRISPKYAHAASFGNGSDIILPMPKEKQRKTGFPILLIGAAATIVIVLSAGYASVLKQNSVYAANIRQIPGLSALPASVDSAFNQIGAILEPLLARQLTYERAGSE